jgi:t-SNARE complex subunit (syntaxin)
MENMGAEIGRLLKNIKKIIAANALDDEFEAAISDADSEDILTVEDLNEYLEESMTYWED